MIAPKPAPELFHEIVTKQAAWQSRRAKRTFEEKIQEVERMQKMAHMLRKPKNLQ